MDSNQLQKELSGYRIPIEPVLLEPIMTHGPIEPRKVRAASPQEIQIGLERAIDGMVMVEESIPTIMKMISGELDGVTTKTRQHVPMGVMNKDHQSHPAVTLFDYKYQADQGAQFNVTTMPNLPHSAKLSWRKTQDRHSYYSATAMDFNDRLVGYYQRPHHSEAINAQLHDVVICRSGRILSYGCVDNRVKLIGPRVVWDAAGTLLVACYYEEEEAELVKPGSAVTTATLGAIPPKGFHYVGRSDLEMMPE